MIKPLLEWEEKTDLTATWHELETPNLLALLRRVGLSWELDVFRGDKNGRERVLRGVFVGWNDDLAQARRGAQAIIETYL